MNELAHLPPQAAAQREVHASIAVARLRQTLQSRQRRAGHPGRGQRDGECLRKHRCSRSTSQASQLGRGAPACRRSALRLARRHPSAAAAAAAAARRRGGLQKLEQRPRRGGGGTARVLALLLRLRLASVFPGAAAAASATAAAAAAPAAAFFARTGAPPGMHLATCCLFRAIFSIRSR